jgi:hypothetical protein
MNRLLKETKSHGYELARNKLTTMSDDELAALTSARLIASYGLKPTEADHLILSIRRV